MELLAAWVRLSAKTTQVGLWVSRCLCRCLLLRAGQSLLCCRTSKRCEWLDCVVVAVVDWSCNSVGERPGLNSVLHRRLRIWLVPNSLVCLEWSVLHNTTLCGDPGAGISWSVAWGLGAALPDGCIALIRAWASGAMLVTLSACSGPGRPHSTRRVAHTLLSCGVQADSPFFSHLQ